MFKSGYTDIETGYGESGALYPGIDYTENVLRWGYIRKVYGILSTQIVLTAIVASVVVFNSAISEFFLRNPAIMILLTIMPLILLCPLYAYHQSHPLNLVLLGLFTVCLSLTVGISCAFVKGVIVLEALILTATVTLALTGYTYWAAKRGYDFSFLGPILFASLFVLVIWGLIQLFLPLGPVSVTIYGAISSIIFSAYIVYDTDNLIKRYSYDEYIWASIAIYLDILNLFLALLNLLRGMQSSD